MKENTVIKICVTIIIILLLLLNCFLTLNVNYIINRSFYPSMYQISIIENELEIVNEKVELLEKNVVQIGEGPFFMAKAFQDIYIKFYDLDITINYTFVTAYNFPHDFNGSTEVTVVMMVHEKNWCGLARENEGIIGVFIGNVTRGD